MVVDTTCLPRLSNIPPALRLSHPNSLKSSFVMTLSRLSSATQGPAGKTNRLSFPITTSLSSTSSTSFSIVARPHSCSPTCIRPAGVGQPTPFPSSMRNYEEPHEHRWEAGSLRGEEDDARWHCPRVQKALELVRKAKLRLGSSDREEERQEYDRFLNLVLGYGQKMLTSSDLDQALDWTFRNHPDLRESYSHLRHVLPEGNTSSLSEDKDSPILKTVAAISKTNVSSSASEAPWARL